MRAVNKETLYGPVGILICWHALTTLELVSPVLLPPPIRVVKRLVPLLMHEGMGHDLLVTAWRSLFGLALGVATGVALGSFLGCFTWWHEVLGGVVDFLRSIAATALLPLFMLAFGIGDTARIALVVFSSSLILTVHTASGVRNRSKVREMVLITLRAKPFFIFRKAIFPDALPVIFTGVRIAISLALVIVVVSEMLIGTTVGLGYRLYNAQLIYDTPQMYAALLLAGGLGLFFNWLFVLLEKRLIHWVGR